MVYRYFGTSGVSKNFACVCFVGAGTACTANFMPCLGMPDSRPSSERRHQTRRAPTLAGHYQLHIVCFHRVGGTTRPGFRPGVIIEPPRSYAFGVCGVVTSVPNGATRPNLQAHFAPLRQLLTFTGNAAGSLRASTAGLVTGFRAGEPGEVPALLTSVVCSSQLPPYRRH